MTVIIVGAGPGGLTLALTLAQFGIKAIILEKEIQRSPFTKALTLQPRTLEVIESLNLLHCFVQKGNLIHKTQFFANSVHVGSINYSDLPSTCGFLLSITQPESESILEDALKTQGILVQRGVVCKDIEIVSGTALVRVEHLDSKKEEVLKADYVVAADGGKSLVRSIFLKKREVKLACQVRYDSNFIMGDFAMENYPFPRDERYTYFKNRAIYALIPMVFPYVRIVAFGLKGVADLIPKVEEFSFITKNIVGLDLDVTKGEWLSRFYPSRFRLDRFRVGPLFFIGDAAHIISPIGAQGINLSIEDAYNLGWKLGMVIAKNHDSSLLDTYSTERIAAADVVLKETNNLHKKLANPLLNFFFMQQLKFIKKPDISRFVLLKQTQFFIDYSSSNRTKSSEFNVGKRLVNAKCLTPLGTSLFDHLSKDTWTVILNFESKEAVNFFTSIYPTLSLSSKPGADLLLDQGDPICKRLKESPPILVISPDKYIYKTFSKADFYDSDSFSWPGNTKKGDGCRPVSKI